MRSNPLFRLLSILLFGLIGLWLIYTFVFGVGFGVGMNMRGYYGGGHMNMYTGLGYGSALAFWLLLLIKVLFFVFVVGLVAGIIVWIKNSFFTAEDYEAMRRSFSGPRPQNIEKCSACGKELNSEWKLCPHCGKEKSVGTV